MAVADLKEITPDTTADDIKAYAEQVVQEVVSDRQGESAPKSDAQIVNEQSGGPKPTAKPTETPAELKLGGESALDGEDTGDTPAVAEWLTDDVKAEAAAYGIEESEMADFASREEFDRALRLFDKTALEAGRKAMAENEEGKVRNEKGQFVKKEQPSADQPKGGAPQDGRYQVALSPDLYDDEIINEFTRMRDHYESRLEVLESHFAEQSAVAEEQRFDSLVDSLAHTELFGVTGKETEQELERRRDLNVAVRAQMIGLAQLGRPAEMSQQLISRVANMAFGEQLSKKLLKQQTSKISKQSQMRQGGSPTKPIPPGDDPRDEADRLYRELERA